MLCKSVIYKNAEKPTDENEAMFGLEVLEIDKMKWGLQLVKPIKKKYQDTNRTTWI